MCVYKINKMHSEALKWWLKSKKQRRTNLVASQSRPDVCDWSRHPLLWFYFTVYHRLLIDMQREALNCTPLEASRMCVCMYLWVNAHCCLWFLVAGKSKHFFFPAEVKSRCEYHECTCIWQACRAYEQFMNDLAKLIRTDRGLAINETRIREEVIRVMDLERDIANVSTYTQTHTHTHTHTH